MSNTKHTPGPWFINGPFDFPGDLFIRGTIIDENGSPENIDIAALCCHEAENIKQIKADAELIAAAPQTAEERDKLKAINAELLEILKELTDYTSEANSLQHSGREVRSDVWSDIYQTTNKAKAIIQKAEELNK